MSNSHPPQHDELAGSNRLPDKSALLPRLTNILADINSLTALLSRRRRYEQVSVGELAHTVWNDLETESATLRISNDQTLIADREWLSLAIQELFSNAIDHAGPEPVVEIGVEEGGIYIQDDGNGISKSAIDGATTSGVTTKQAGSGFGFTIVKHVVRAHGWAYRVTEGDLGGVRVELEAESSEPYRNRPAPSTGARGGIYG